MKGIVDRIEDGILVLEVNENYFNLNLEDFPEEIKEGDLIEYKDGICNILKEETIVRQKNIRSLFDSLLEKD